MRKILAMLLGLACYSPVEFDYPAKRLDPPEWYKQAWVDVKACAGKASLPLPTFEQVDFYVLETDSFTVNGKQTTAAASGWDVFLARSVVDSTRHVKHEMMHVATQIYRHTAHPFYSCKLMWGQ
jgi:hypothetical protein